MSHRLTYPWGSRTKTFLVLLGRGMVNQGRRRRRRSLSLFSGLLESVLAAMTCRAVCYFDFWFVRLYRSLFPLLFVWKECRIFGFWYSSRILHHPFHSLGPCQHSLLRLNSRLLFVFTWIWMLYLLLCLWLSEGTSLQIQFAGSTLWGLCYSLFLPSLCHLSRVQGDS
ncbi:uncharacterized protein [Gossypium hirsutum]|uniref:Uncharacterized protein isoform X2 n=1 Tax=Gossypium hirsutum TaxID=3635 RepID=A0ABM2ZY23_GOSHI|nr:uncharacterized protein LOC107931536 isoform X2 [Gossypium hirsutum]